jgi:hypothetical protein
VNRTGDGLIDKPKQVTCKQFCKFCCAERWLRIYVYIYMCIYIYTYLCFVGSDVDLKLRF